MKRSTRCDGENGPPLTVHVPEDIAQMVEHLSGASGAPANDLVISALREKFAPIAPTLMAEFAFWEQASEYDATRCGTFRGDL